jgi:hypothetical protein
MIEGFDIVTVPDFSGRAKAKFEARTLLFLAAWLENAGNARNFPLHLACIGEPPPSVRQLAGRCGANLTIHQPLQADKKGAANKLRGLEVKGQTRQVLLLDADVVILSDPSSLVDLGHCLAASPAVHPRVPEEYWRKIYTSLGRPLPSERIRSLTDELDRVPLHKPHYPGQNDEAKAMVPYFNSGVVYAPWDCDLRAIWENNIRYIASLFSTAERVSPWISSSDQAGMALSFQMLREKGVPFHRLSAADHTVPIHIFRHALALSDIKLFHALGLFGGDTLVKGLRPALGSYRNQSLMRLADQCVRELFARPDPRLVWRYFWPAFVDVYRLGIRLQELYQKHLVGLVDG